METRTLGQDLDARGLTVALEEGDIISDVILLSEVLKADGSKGFVISRPPHTNWLKEIGMLTKAQKILLDGPIPEEEH